MVCISAVLPITGGFYRLDGVVTEFTSMTLPGTLNKCVRQLMRAWVMIDDSNVIKAYKSLFVMLIRAVVSGNGCQAKVFEV